MLVMIRQKVLNTVHNFLERVQTELGIHVDFSSIRRGVSINGLFKDNKVTGMMEAKDFETADYISLFVGAIFNWLCDGEDEDPVIVVLR